MHREDEKVAIVTGGGQGIGAAVAGMLAAAGVYVAVNDLNPDRAEKIAAEITAGGGEAIPVAADISNRFQCVHLIETTRAKWGGLHILINNAAVQPHAPILSMDEWVWNRCLEVNLKGVFFMSQLCGRVMADENQRQQSTIVNITSTAGPETALANRSAYCASKAGVMGFARECAREFATYGIDVYTLLPVEDPVDITDLRQKVAEMAAMVCLEHGRYPTGAMIPIHDPD